ncbi:MAG: DUF6090 family protein [Flavobacteriaceae bacterium]|nr:hypothetical protein [Flavobacteriaceae bacterium]
MLSFFRRIRKSLIANGSARKYIFYAIGEIVLVVIGILIAINLNNNNQNKISKYDRNEKIEKLRHIIYEDSLELSFIIEYNRNASKVLDSLLISINTEMNQEDYVHFAKSFVKVNFEFRNTVPNLSIYDELVSSGEYSKIEDETLKTQVSAYFRLYTHFNNLIIRFVNALNISQKQLYYQGILSHRNFRNNLSDEAYANGYNDFMVLLNDPVKKKIFENHLYELKDVHDQIAMFYNALCEFYMQGLPLKPQEITN